MRVLAIGAHPDDLELLCAGTLAKYANQGHQVIMCHACNGNLGHFEIPRNELRDIRRQEAQNAAAVIGAESLTLDIADLDVYVERETKEKMTELIRKTKPDVIIAPSPDDYMPDHTLISRIAFDASFMATLPQLATETECHHLITPFYYMDTLAGVNFQPEVYVDITEVIEIKKRMLACHKSQTQWLKHHDKIDIIEFMITVARFRGLQCGVQYAEGFKPCRVWGRNTTKRWLP
ncbi:MAG: PIG-L family deacetylase [Deltaproteobacteria bacterium]|nr:MAG: PIG-L family deacetylase [candidate division KSB1 bacterium]RLB89412.1 MAG: PIG-L family deacetylase [Deltaproteobacteria bacterium]